jgi:hypothetical protein
MPTANGTPVIRTALAIGVMGVIWTAVPSVDGWIKSRFANRLARHAEASAGDVARLAVRRLSDSGQNALPALVQVAASTNGDAADAARNAVLNHLAAWQIEFQARRNAIIHAERLDKLARALLTHIGQFDPVGRAWADRIALTIVRQCDALPAGAAAPLLANCDSVLRAPQPKARAPAVVARTAAPAQAPRATTPPAVVAPPSTTVELPQTEADDAAPLESGLTTPSQQSAMAIVQAPPVAPQVPPQSSTNNQPQPTSDAIAEAPIAEPPIAASAQPRPLPPPPAESSLVDVPSPTEARILLRRYRQLSLSELRETLAATRGYESLAVQQVLRERQAPAAAGPRAVSPQSPPSDAEQHLSERISSLSAAEGRDLLRNLASNPAEPAEQRLQALALLATSGDPQLASIARERALNDPDPSVADLASRILRDSQQR